MKKKSMFAPVQTALSLVALSANDLTSVLTEAGQRLDADDPAEAQESKVNSVRSGASMRGQQVAQMAVSNAKADPNATVADAVIGASVVEVANLHAKHEKNKFRIDNLLEATQSLGSAVAGLAASAIRSGMVDAGDFTKNLAHGKVFINGKPFDLQTFLAGLVALRTAIIIEEIPSTAPYLDHFYTTAPPVEAFIPAGRVEGTVTVTGSGDATSVTATPTSKYYAKDVTHVKVLAIAGTSGSFKIGDEVWVPIADAFDSPPKDGDVFPTDLADGYANPSWAIISLISGDASPTKITPTCGLELARFKPMRLAHTTTGWLSAAASIGLSSMDSALANVASLVPAGISGLLKQASSTDLAR
jgi:hypothetical protein